MHLWKNRNKFLASLLRKVRFGVWIDILAKEKFSNLSKKKIIFLFLFVSYLNFVYLTFLLFCIFFTRC